MNAYTALDGTVFQGRMLHLIAGKSKPSDAETAGIINFRKYDFSVIL